MKPAQSFTITTTAADVVPVNRCRATDRYRVVRTLAVMAFATVTFATVTFAAIACRGPAPEPPATAAAGDPVDPRCVFPAEPTLLARHGTATIEQWELPAADVLDSPLVPDDADYLAYRGAIRDADADLKRPIADRAPMRSDAEREIWRREDHNAELVHSGQVGRLRPVHCLEALLFARQHRRHSQLTHPTEFLASVLRKQGRLRILFTSADEMFPPKELYGFDQIEAAIADGWEPWFVLHNHTIQRHDGRPALGQPVPSASDVQLLSNVVPSLGVQQVRVTNGLYTVEIDAADLARMESPPEPAPETAPPPP